MTKYIYERIIQSNYGYGWEDTDTVNEDNSERFLLQEYRMACPQCSHRAVSRRTLRNETAQHGAQ